MRPKIIAILDTVAQDLAGPITIHKHAASAIRFFGDVASHPDSQIGRHVEDYILVELGEINDDFTILPDKKILITGSQWAASQQQQKENTSLPERTN